ncbi:hypothetical protein [Jiulongibacter sediminis]|uniref:Aromatic hydrocarbon degradation membrane protein n=1 Tax=Jiulongibacter sediminis TaxID=1605367 RepID=A0A0P7C4P0_9BACT|nr:hypothetical protein [Jiulongibacter sediminis]KPM49310.1 hypothetical protein AFM12_01410 [Jiulongibacter sediminis]TBX26361.1 hypothetical protein TK44_01415 [Jiulongibacter sediminis]
MLRTKKVLFSFLSLILSATAFGQGQGNTPYSVFGIGELAEPTAASQEMMGGTGASFANAFYINQINPALLVKNRVASGYKYVAFNVGFRGNARTITTENLSQRDFGFNLDNLSLTVPVTTNWAMGASLRPYSMVDHKTKYDEAIIGAENEVYTKEVYNTGGISRASFTNSFRIFNSLYVGLEANYNFGTINKDSSSYLFGNASNQLRTNTRYAMKGGGLKFGMAYQQKLNDKWQVNIGGAVERSAELKGDVLRTFGSYADVGNGPFITRVPDTLALNDISVKTPTQYRVGISLESPFKWIFAADYHTTKWSTAQNLDALAERIKNDTEEYKFGLEYLPNSSSTRYLSQVFYRLGYSTSQTAYVINGTRIKDNKFSMGVSVPMGYRNPSYVNLGVAFGNRGVITNNLIRENYVRLSISATLLSPWFIQPRID